jgi:hypothetical protein
LRLQIPCSSISEKKMISSASIGSGVSPIADAELILTPLDQEGVIQQLLPVPPSLRQRGGSGLCPTDPGDAADLSTPQGISDLVSMRTCALLARQNRPYFRLDSEVSRSTSVADYYKKPLWQNSFKQRLACNILFVKHIFSNIVNGPSTHRLFFEKRQDKRFSPLSPALYAAADGTNWRIVSMKRETEIGFET